MSTKEVPAKFGTELWNLWFYTFHQKRRLPQRASLDNDDDQSAKQGLVCLFVPVYLSQRYTYEQIRNDPWFREGYIPVRPLREDDGSNLADIDAVFAGGMVRRRHFSLRSEQGSAFAQPGAQRARLFYLRSKRVWRFFLRKTVLCNTGAPVAQSPLRRLVTQVTPSHNQAVPPVAGGFCRRARSQRTRVGRTECGRDRRR